MPTVGIAVPFYADIGYLGEALRSLIAQTDEGWTAVVVDDASPEPGAAAVVEELGDERIRYERNAVNLGLSGNFNRCLAAPGTPTVALFHADDLLEPNYVATVRALHEDCPGAALVSPMARAIDADGAPLDTLVDKVKRHYWPKEQRAVLRGDDGLARLMTAFFVYCPALSYRPALLPEGGFDPRWRQVMDLDLFVRVLLDDGSIALDRTVAYAYRRHGGTVTAHNARSFTFLDEELALAGHVAAAAQRRGWTRTNRAARLQLWQRLNGLSAVARSIGRPANGRGAALRTIVSLPVRSTSR